MRIRRSTEELDYITTRRWPGPRGVRARIVVRPGDPIGYDDPLATWVRPMLTTVALPHYELGQTALNVLFDDDERPEVKAAAHVHRITMPVRARDSVRVVDRAGRR